MHAHRACSLVCMVQLVCKVHHADLVCCLVFRRTVLPQSAELLDRRAPAFDGRLAERRTDSEALRPGKIALVMGRQQQRMTGWSRPTHVRCDRPASRSCNASSRPPSLTPNTRWWTLLTSSFSSASRTHWWSSLVAASAAIVRGAACCRCVSAWHKNPCTRRTISPTVEGVTCSSSSASTKRCTPASETGASACKSVTRWRVSMLRRAARAQARRARAQLRTGAQTEQRRRAIPYWNMKCLAYSVTSGCLAVQF